MWNNRTSRPNLIEGKGIPFYAGKGNQLERDHEQITPEYLNNKIHEFISLNNELFKIDFSRMQLNAENSHLFENGRYAVMQYDYHMGQCNLSKIKDKPPFTPICNPPIQPIISESTCPVIDDARIYFRFNNGNLIQFGSMNISDVQIPILPEINSSEAQANVMTVFNSEQSKVKEIEETRLTIVPELPAEYPAYADYQGREGEGLIYRLVWKVRFQLNNEESPREAWIDAHNGKILFYQYLGLSGDVTGNVNVAVGDRRTKLFPSCRVNNNGLKFTNFFGNYLYTSTPSSSSSTNIGDLYINITDHCDTGTILVSTNSSPGDLIFGESSGSDCDTPGSGGPGNTYAARSTFWHQNLIRTKAKFHLPGLTWLDLCYWADTNIDDSNWSCNAQSNAINSFFYRSSSLCNNSGEVPGAVYHEWGHSLDFGDGGPSRVPSNELSSGEAVADTMNVLMTKESCIGQGISCTFAFFKP